MSIVIYFETWLNNNVFDEKLGFCNYNIFRNDRDFSLGNKRSGRVLDDVPKKIQCELLCVPIVPGIEQIFIKIEINNINIILGCIYIPPDTTNAIYYSHYEVVETKLTLTFQIFILSS